MPKRLSCLGAKVCLQYVSPPDGCVWDEGAALLDVSLDMGFLTGQETQDFLDAHVAAAFITGEPFAEDEYDFATCAMTQRNRCSCLHFACRQRGRGWWGSFEGGGMRCCYSFCVVACMLS